MDGRTEGRTGGDVEGLVGRRNWGGTSKGRGVSEVCGRQAGPERGWCPGPGPGGRGMDLAVAGCAQSLRGFYAWIIFPTCHNKPRQ